MRSLFLVIFLSGCLDVFRTDPPAEPRVELGGSSEYPYEFAPLTDDTLAIIAGPSGYWFFQLGGYAHNVPETIRVSTKSVRRLSTNQEVNADWHDVAILLDEYYPEVASGYFAGYQAHLDHPDIFRIVCEVEGEQMQICLTVTDPETEASGDGCATVTVVLDSHTEELCAE